MDRDALIAHLQKLPKGTKVGLITDLGLNAILWQPVTSVAIRTIDKQKCINAHGKSKVAIISS